MQLRHKLDITIEIGNRSLRAWTTFNTIDQMMQMVFSAEELLLKRFCQSGSAKAVLPKRFLPKWFCQSGSAEAVSAEVVLPKWVCRSGFSPKRFCRSGSVEAGFCRSGSVEAVFCRSGILPLQDKRTMHKQES